MSTAYETAWQPIETAPRDGTAVLVYIPYTDKTFPVFVSGYMDEMWCIPNSGSYPLTHEPTHWMTIPDTKGLK